MAQRGAGYITLTGSAQPTFGTAISAATQPTPDQFTGSLSSASMPSRTTFTVGSTAWFRKGDRVLVGPAAGPFDQGVVLQVVSSTSIIIQGLQSVHAAAEFLILSIETSRIRIRAGNSGLYLGTDSTVGAASTTLFDNLNPGEVYDIGQSSVGNTYGTGTYWMLGTAADTCLPSIMLI